MFVTIDENDRVVLRYEVPADLTGRISGSVFLIVHDIEISGTYSVLWKAHTNDTLEENQYDLMWRGSFETCMDRFSDEVIEFETTAITPTPVSA